MLTIEGIFDGHRIECLGNVPFTQKKRVLITFLDEMMFESEKAVAPVEVDPIAALRGRDKHAHVTEKLLIARKEGYNGR